LKYGKLNGTVESRVNFKTEEQDYDEVKRTVKKKKMLDLMIQKKLSTKKKKIIKTYGQDMIAEMYLDLLNVTEYQKNHIKDINIHNTDENPQDHHLSDYIENQESIFNG